MEFNPFSYEFRFLYKILVAKEPGFGAIWMEKCIPDNYFKNQGVETLYNTKV
ncbi:MAG: hypothetical protein GY795_51420 [Desulfobacterales bacterium]|nr:hypothetical protein [Desulfobacterales bacterium]